jgi:hypothetical protein
MADAGSYKQQEHVLRVMDHTLATELVPDANDLKDSLLNMVALCRLDDGYSVAEWDTTLSKDQQHRSRWRPPPGKLFPAQIWGPTFSRGLTAYYLLMPKEIRKEFLTNLRAFKWLDTPHTEEWILTSMGRLSQIANKYGPQFSKYWTFYLGLDTLGDYKLPMEQDEFDAEVKEWLGKESRFYGTEGTEGLYKKFWKESVDLWWMHGTNVDEEKFPTWDEWLNDPGYYITQGSSYHKLLQWKDKDGALHWGGRSKANTAWCQSTDDLRDELETIRPIELRPAVKRERKRARPVIGVQDASFKRQRYLYEWASKLMAGTTVSPNFMREQQRWLDKQEFIMETGLTTVKLPADISRNDQEWQWWEFIGQMLGLRRAIERCAGTRKNDLLRVWDIEYRSITTFRNKHPVVQNKSNGRHHITYWTSGLPTGMGFTSLFNTCRSYALTMACGKLCERLIGIDPITREPQTLGDDIHLYFSTLKNAVLWYITTTIVDINFHTQKFFLAIDRDDFLRVLSLKGVMSTGPPARLITSLLWRNPVNRPPPKGAARMREQADLWSKADARGLIVKPWIYQDLARGNGISIDLTKQLCQTPGALGGLGVDDFSGRGAVEITYAQQVTRGKVINEPLGYLNLVEQYPNLPILSVVKRRLTYGETVGAGFSIQPVKEVPVRLWNEVTPITTSVLPAKIWKVKSPTAQSAAEDLALRSWEVAKWYLEPESMKDWDGLRRTMSLKAWGEAWRGEPAITPLCVQNDPKFCSYIGTQIWRGCYVKELKFRPKKSLSFKAWTALKVTAEELARRYLQGMPYYVGA